MTDSGKSKWISVKDRLPAYEAQMVLAYNTDYPGIHICCLSYRGEFCTDDDVLYSATHWQPLPDPPTIEAVATPEAPANDKPSVTTGDAS